MGIVLHSVHRDQLRPDGLMILNSRRHGEPSYCILRHKSREKKDIRVMGTTSKFDRWNVHIENAKLSATCHHETSLEADSRMLLCVAGGAVDTVTEGDGYGYSLYPSKFKKEYDDICLVSIEHMSASLSVDIVLPSGSCFSTLSLSSGPDPRSHLQGLGDARSS